MSFEGLTSEEFQKHVKRRASGHWEWIGPRSANGIPWLCVGKHTYRAYRIAWLLYNGDIEQGMTLRKVCDHPGCINPKCREKVPTSEQTQGSRHGKSKLTETDIIDIREAYENGSATQKELAQKYGVSQPLMSQIVNGKAWTHVK